MDKDEIQDCLTFGFSILDQSRAFILKKMKEGFTVEMKMDETVVTVIDQETERLMKKEILKRYPSHGILGEEFGSINEASAYRWLIDPIDGTEAFVKGSKDYGTLLALQYNQKTVLGLIDHPSHALRYHAYVGGGTYRGSTKLFIKDVVDSFEEKEMLAVCREAQFKRHGALKVYEKIWQIGENVKELSDCFGHTRVLEGSFGAMIDYNLSLWDIEATRILVEEAGGKFVVKDEKKRPDGTIVYGVVFGKPKLVDRLCRLF